jgi:hypothetical protein
VLATSLIRANINPKYEFLLLLNYYSFSLLSKIKPERKNQFELAHKTADFMCFILDSRMRAFSKKRRKGSG